MLFNKQTFDRIHDRLHRSGKVVDAPLGCDRWIASSVLQKSIRRGDVELAQRAACTLHAFDRGAIWRRLVVIACEDVGVGDIDALLETLLAAASTDFRRQCGEASVLGAVVRRLAEAVKDRSADYLACAATDHPDLSATCRFCKEASLEKRLELLTDFSQPLAKRAVAAWYASGINPRYQNQVQGGDLHALAAAYRSLGAGDELTHSMVLAAKRAREVLVVLAPLIWLEVRRGGPAGLRSDPIPQSRKVAGIPLYAFDKHTRVGKRAIERLIGENKPFRDCLVRFLAKGSPRKAAEIAAFYADGAPVAQRLDWAQSDGLERLGNQEACLWAENPQQETPNFLPALRIAAASNALAGRLAEAQKAIVCVRQIDPTLRVSNLKDWVAFRRPEDLAKLEEGLRKAGLPE